jgi:hypothetical protein
MKKAKYKRLIAAAPDMYDDLVIRHVLADIKREFKSVVALERPSKTMRDVVISLMVRYIQENRRAGR